MDQLSHEQKLKRTMHLQAQAACIEAGTELGVTFNKDALELVGEVAWTVTRNFARDLELFARHAKRSSVNADDVKLLVRKNPALTKTVIQMAAAQAEARAKRKSANKDEPAAKVANREEAPAGPANEEPLAGPSWLDRDADFMES